MARSTDQADVALAAEFAELAPGTTDEIPL
jgi:hypothetical protein